MNQTLTELVIILDRSGSMAAIREDMEGGLKELIAAQAKLPGECHLTFAMFDRSDYGSPKHEPIVHWICQNRHIAEVPTWSLIPRGDTPLLDAVGTVITLVGERLAKTPEEERPGKVIVAIITDGQENSSREWTQDKVTALLKRQQEEFNWGVTFLGCAIDAWSGGASVGATASNAASYTPQSSGKAMGMLHNKMMMARSAPIGSSVNASLGYSQDERDELDPDNKARNTPPQTKDAK